MVLNINIENISNDFLNNINVASLNKFLFDSILVHLKSHSDINKTDILLPASVTKYQRYMFHKLTIRNEFVPESYTNQNGDRVMELCISKNYIEDLFTDYVFPKETIPVVEPTPTETALKTDKELLFDTLMSFIQNNLSEEFDKWMKFI